MVVLARLEVFRHLRNTHTFKRINDEHRVVCSQRTSTFGNNIGVGNVVFICCFHERVNAVVDILLNGVVYRTFRVAGTRTIIVYTETTTTVHKLHVEPHSVELHIELCRFAKGGRDTANLCNLRTNVEVHQLKAFAHAHLVEHFKGLEEFGRVEAKL